MRLYIFVLVLYGKKQLMFVVFYIFIAYFYLARLISVFNTYRSRFDEDEKKKIKDKKLGK